MEAYQFQEAISHSRHSRCIGNRKFWFQSASMHLGTQKPVGITTTVIVANQLLEHNTGPSALQKWGSE
jgi:hypothetical protein